VHSALRFGIDTHTTSTVVQDPGPLHNLELYAEAQPIFNLDKKARGDISIIGRGDLKLLFTLPESEPYKVLLLGGLLAQSDEPDKELVLLKAKSFSGTKQMPIHASPPRLIFQDERGDDAAAVKLSTSLGQFFILSTRVSVFKHCFSTTRGQRVSCVQVCIPCQLERGSHC
jgi:hypothetical protein